MQYSSSWENEIQKKLMVTGYNERGGICRGFIPTCTCSPLHRGGGGGGGEGDGGQHGEEGGQLHRGAQRGRRRGRAPQTNLSELHPPAKSAAGITSGYFATTSISK